MTFQVLQDVTEGTSDPVVRVELRPHVGGCTSTTSGEATELTVTLQSVVELAEVAGCADPAPGVATDPDDGCRRDASGALIDARIRISTYEAILPAAECEITDSGALVGPTVSYTVLVEDPTGTIAQPAVCFTYGQSDPTLVVTEYQPRNETTMYFICESCNEASCCVDDCASATCATDECLSCVEIEGIGIRRVRTPDWIEVFNYGDEPIDTTEIGFRGRVEPPDPLDPTPDDDNRLVTWRFGEDTDFDEHMTTIGPGEFRIILADGDGGATRRLFRRVTRDADGRWIPDLDTRYYSTRFRLNPTRASGADEFLLGVESSRSVLDQVILEFRAYAQEQGLPFDDFLLEDSAVGRFPDDDDRIPPGATGRDRYPPNVLQPGRVTPCPTPGEPNELLCDVAPDFDLATSAWPRCPDAGEPVTVRTRLSIDVDSPPDFGVALTYTVDGGVGGTLTRSEGEISVELSGDQSRADPGAEWYDVEGSIPGLEAGAIVEFAWTADVLLETRSGLVSYSLLLDERQARAEGAEAVSFRYAVAPEIPMARPRIEEVLPRNRGVELPGFRATERPDYIELALSAEADVESIELGDYFLTQERGSEDDGTPIARPRLWRFPDGLRLGRGERLILVFSRPAEPHAGVVFVDAFDLESCGETVYLIGPDDRGNCIVDQLTWWGEFNVPCIPDAQGDGSTPADDLAIGRVCGDDTLSLLTVPTPGAENSLAPIIAGVFHQSFTVEPNPCVSAGEFFQIQATVLVDAAIADRFGAEALASAYIEFEDGARIDVAANSVRRTSLPEAYPDAFDVPLLCATNREPCYSALSFTENVLAPPDTGETPILRYRVGVVDACGREIEACSDGDYCFSVGTDAQALPSLTINEVNRFAAVTDSARRPWIEIFNSSDVPVDLSGLSLSNDVRIPRLAVFPDGAVVPANGYLVVFTDGRDALEGPGVPPNLSLHLPWAQVFRGTARIRKCRLRGELLLYDRVENGSCLVSRFSDGGAPSSFPGAYRPSAVVRGNPTTTRIAPIARRSLSRGCRTVPDRSRWWRTPRPGLRTTRRRPESFDGATPPETIESTFRTLFGCSIFSSAGQEILAAPMRSTRTTRGRSMWRTHSSFSRICFSTASRRLRPFRNPVSIRQKTRWTVPARVDRYNRLPARSRSADSSDTNNPSTALPGLPSPSLGRWSALAGCLRRDARTL